MKEKSFKEEEVKVLCKRDIYVYEQFLNKWWKKGFVSFEKKKTYANAKPFKKRYLLELDIKNNPNMPLYEKAWASKWLNEFGKAAKV